MKARGYPAFLNLLRTSLSVILCLLLAPGPDLLSAAGLPLAKPTGTSVAGVNPPTTSRSELSAARTIFHANDNKQDEDKKKKNDEGDLDVTLDSPTTPSSGVPGITLIAVTGNHFPKDRSPVKVKIHLAPKVKRDGPRVSTSPSSVTAVSATSWRFLFTIPVSIKVAKLTKYEVRVSGNLRRETNEDVKDRKDEKNGEGEGEDDGRHFDSEDAASLDVEPTGIPVANPGGPYSGNIGWPITFDGSKSADPAGQTLTYAWNFGDNTSGTGVNPMHAYSSAGAFTVSLTVTNTGGGTNTATTTATIAPAILTGVNPNTGHQGQLNLSVSLTGQFTHWVQGTTVASFGAGVTVVSLTVTSTTNATAVLNIDTRAQLGARTVAVITTTEIVSLTNGFTVTNGTPALTLVNPNTGQQGQLNLSVDLAGEFTQWVQGTSTASFGAGVTVVSLSVASPTHATAVLNIDSAAQPGPRTVSVTTNAEIESLNNGFIVTNGTPMLTLVNPNTGQQGQQSLSVALTGHFTHWFQGTTAAHFGAGVTVSSLTVTSPTSATAVLNIDVSAQLGARDVSVITNAEITSLSNDFTVTSGIPVLTQVNPNTGQQGQQSLSVNLAGQFTHWVQGTSTASFGAGITVASLTVNSSASATAVLNIDPAAVVGARDVSVTTSAEIVTLINGFTVTNGTPALILVNPNTGQQGQQNLSVNLTGQFTHWVQGTSTGSFGAGITVASLTINSPTTATAVVNIDGAVPVGTVQVCYWFEPCGSQTALFDAPTFIFTNTSTSTITNAVFTVGPGGVSSSDSFNIGTINPGQVVNVTPGVSNDGGTNHTFFKLVSGGNDTSDLGPNSNDVQFSFSGLIGTSAVTASFTPAATAGPSGTIPNINFLGGPTTASCKAFTTLGVPGAVFTEALRINDIGQIVGGYDTSNPNPSFTEHGFLTNDRVKFTTVDYPGAPRNGIWGVNSSGQIIGTYCGAGSTGLPAGCTSEFGFFNSGTTFKTITSNPGNAIGINSQGQIVGTQNGGTAGYLTSDQGATFTPIVFPNSSQGEPTAIDDSGKIAGWFQDASGLSHGFTYNGTSYTQFDVPGATATFAWGMNNADQIVGQFSTDGGKTYHGFVTADAVTFTQLDVPGAVSTQAFGINLAGQIVGRYQDAASSTHGFLASLTPCFSEKKVADLVLTGTAAQLGPRTVSVTTNAEVVALANAFTVTSMPVLTQVSPNAGSPGQQNLSVNLAGEFTHWVQGTSTASFGPGITVTSLTVSSLASATAVLNIDPTATVGPRTVSVTTNAEVVSLINGFTVTSGAPALISVVPNTGSQGQLGLSVNLTGEFTHWLQGTSTANFGPGVTVASLTVNSPTTATAALNIDGAISVGTVQVCYWYSPCGTQTTGLLHLYDAPTFVLTNTSTSIITNAVFTVGPGGVSSSDSFSIGTINPGQTISVTPGISDDGGTNHTFFKLVPGGNDTSDLGPNSNNVQLGFTGLIGSATVTISFTPAATAGPNGTIANINFLGGPTNATCEPFTKIDVPGSVYTFANGINDKNQVVGGYDNANPNPPLIAQHGYVTNDGGKTFTTIDYPGASLGSVGYTVDNNSQIVGVFCCNSGERGYRYDGTTFSAITIPNAVQNTAEGSLANGYITGAANYGTNLNRGFISRDNGATFTLFDYPGSNNTVPQAVNDGGQIVGYIVDSSGANHGFLTALTTFNQIDVPGSTSTVGQGINHSGQIVGLFTSTSGGPSHAFMTVDRLTFTQFDLPGAASTQAAGTNTAGKIVGTYGDASGSRHGFLASLAPCFAQRKVADLMQTGAAAQLGPRTVSVTTGAEVVSLANAFTVTNTPVLLHVNPNTGVPGQQSLSVVLTGLFTHWLQGTTIASLGPGITVVSLTVASPTSATAVLNIDPTAQPGARNITVTTGSEIVSLISGFFVAGLVQVNPSTASQGQQNLSVNLTGLFTHWVQGTTTASFGAGITVASLTVNSSSSATAVVNIDLAAQPGARNVTLTTGAEVVTLANGFTVTIGIPVLTQVNPNSGQQGRQNLSVAITGLFTHFAQGTTTASFGAGITVASLTVNSPTSATAVLNISPTAAGGTRSVTLTTGTEVASLANGFTVTNANPVLTQVNPNGGQQGQLDLTVALNGRFTHWAQGATTVNFGAGITVVLLAVSSSISATALLNIDTAAAIGPRNVTVITGTEVATLAGGFTVTPQAAAGPSIVSITPNLAVQGQSLQVTITAQGTNFVQGTTKANFGPGVSVNGAIVGTPGLVQVTSPTTATVQISVPANATPGQRSVVVQTGSEEESLFNGFTVVGTPYLSSITPGRANPGQSLTVTINGIFTHFQQGVTTATFGAGISVGGAAQGTPGPVTVTGPNTATAQLSVATGATPGLRNPVVTTGTENASLINDGFLVLGPVTGPPPIVAITSPVEAAEITAPTAVTGTVTSPNLASWTLDYEASGSTIFTTFATGTTSIVGGQFDPTVLLNGIAQIRLTGVDQSGQTAQTSVSVVVSRKLKIGNFTLSFNDLTVPVAGIPIQITRTYDSRDKGVGDFGFGWRLSIKTIKVDNNAVIGNNWMGTVSGFPLPTYCIQDDQPHVITFTLQDGTVYQFQPIVSPQCQDIYPPTLVDVSFVPIGATPPNASLSVAGSTGLLVSGGVPGPVSLFDANNANSFDPDQFQLTLPTGQTLFVSKTFGVQGILDTNGNTLSISSTGITSSNGKGVLFQRDTNTPSRITTITDPNGNILQYAYDSNGDLSTFADQLKNISTFTYDGAHYLLSYTDPRGIQPLRNIYDDSGHLIEQIDASGHVRNFSHNTASNSEAFTDFLGYTTTYVYDKDGNIIQETDPLGNVTSRTFDAHDNLLSETNALGQTRSYTYDAANNQLTQTDPLGHTVKYTYNSLNQPLTITDPNGNTHTNAYDANGNLLTTTDALGNTTKRTYDSNGLPTSMTDALGHTTNYGYNTTGNLAIVTDSAGTVTSYSYDANANRVSETNTRTTPAGPQTLNNLYAFDAANNLVTTTFPDGSTAHKSYNPLGKPASITDELGRTTSYEYDGQGRLTLATYPDGSQGLSAYDANGNRIQFTGPSGASSSFTYDGLGRVTTTSNNRTGASTRTTYDAVGHTIAETDPSGNATQYTYDAAGRRTSIINALHQVTSLVFDAAGNQVSETDAIGNTTTRQYDSSNRPVRVTYPDGTFEQTAYDPVGRIVSKTDAAGNSTQSGFDSVGRLISVTDALGHVTKFTYDELGHRISQTDANNHTTTFEYDQRGRRTRRTLPAGQTESFAHDLAGNVISHTDFNGKTTTYVYDSNNRLLSKVPDPSFGAPAVTFTYTISGNRASMTDAIGTSTYQHDSADRLVQVVKPNGTLVYTYDSAGHLTSLASGGTQVSYTYDPLNRLAGVTEAGTGATSYTYDGVGNLAAINLPNGVTSIYNYNTRNELTSLGINKGTANIASYAYTLDAAGHRLTVAEVTGRTVNYSYDHVYRLTSETVSAASTGPNGTVNYTYDAVGNRSQTTSTLAGVASGTFSYDADDRLGSDTYDANGDTASSNGIANVYDFENHLIQRGSVTMVYDGDGNRVEKIVGGVSTKYLVDDHSLTGFPQVIAETKSDGSAWTYIYGLERISQRQATLNSSTPVTSFYMYDGHGSVRALMNPTGAITDTYDYDAFGNLINSSGSTANEFLFAGEQFDSDLRLYYNRARYLDPSSGRFWTMDRLEGDSQTPASLHKYLYASGDPVDRIDPSGNQDLGELAVTLGIQSVLSELSLTALNSPLGQSAAGIVASALLPPGYFDKLATSLTPSVFLGGGGGSVTASRFGVGLTAGIAGEVLWSPNTHDLAAFVNLSGGLAFGAKESEPLGFAGYVGAIYHLKDSREYSEGLAVNLSFPTPFVPRNVVTKLDGDLRILMIDALVAASERQFRYYTSSLEHMAQLADRIFRLSGEKSTLYRSYINFFFDPGHLGKGVGGSISFSSASSASGVKFAITLSQSFQLWPTENEEVLFDTRD